MRSSFWTKLGISLPLIIALVLLDHVATLQGLPLLVGVLGLAFLMFETLRVRLHARGRANVAALPSMAAALVLLLAFCKDRPIPQAVLLLVTIAVVFDILMVALALIAEASKRGVKGVLEFAGLVGVGLAVGLVLSLVFIVGPGRPGGVSLAGP